MPSDAKKIAFEVSAEPAASVVGAIGADATSVAPNIASATDTAPIIERRLIVPILLVRGSTPTLVGGAYSAGEDRAAASAARDFASAFRSARYRRRIDLSVIPWSSSLGGTVQEAFAPTMHWTMDQGRAMWRDPTDGEQWSRCLVLLDAGRPIAVASAFHPRLHASREWAYVEVVAAHQGQGVGGMALAELRRALPPGARPLRAKVVDESAGARFAERNGFTAIQGSRLVAVTVPDEPPRLDIVYRGGTDDDVVLAWRNFYVPGHDWDPPGDVGFDVWRALTPNASRIVIVGRGGATAGVAFVIDDGDGELRFVGGAIDRRDPDAIAIAHDLLVAAAARAARRRLIVELDDWMWELAAAIESMPSEALDRTHTVAERPPEA